MRMDCRGTVGPHTGIWQGFAQPEIKVVKIIFIKPCVSSTKELSYTEI